MNNFVPSIKKLQRALNVKGYRFLYNTNEFYSTKMQRTVIMFSIKYADIDEIGNVNNRLLFKTPSQIRVVLFLRDIYECVTDGMTDIDVMVEKALRLQNTYLTKHDYLEEKEKGN